MIPKLTEVFQIGNGAQLPADKKKSESNIMDPMHGKDEQTYDPSDAVRFQWATENVAGGMGGAGAEDGDGGEEEAMELAGAQ